MYLADPITLPSDLWGMMRSTMQLLQQTLFCLAAFLTSANVITNGAQGVQGVAGQYLLGLGEYDVQS